MTSALARKAGLKLFEKHLQKYEPKDPVYENYVDEKGRQKRRRRDLPPGLSERDARILRSVQNRAYHLDRGFSICGLRFGWTGIVGIVPVVGDLTAAGVSYVLVVKKARKADLPPWLTHRLLFNNALSAALGFIPLVGDLFVVTFKANSRNAALLEEFLRVRGEEYLRVQAELEAEERVKAGGQGQGVGSGTGGTNGNGRAGKRTFGFGFGNGSGSGSGFGNGKGPREDPAVVKPGAGKKVGEGVTI